MFDSLKGACFMSDTRNINVIVVIIFPRFLSHILLCMPKVLVSIPMILRPYEKILVSCPSAHHFWRVHQIFFISLNLMYLAQQLIVFRWKQIHFALYFNENTFLSDFTICFYGRNTFHMTCGKCKIILVSKISTWTCRKDKKK